MPLQLDAGRVTRWVLIPLLTLEAVFVFPGALEARVFLSRQEALRAAFSENEAVETRDLFLTDAQVAAVQQLAGAKLESPMVTVYVGQRGGKVAGLAIFDTQLVRSMPETLLVVLGEDGTVRRVLMCAFHEPEEYLPSARWFDQFQGRTAGDPLRVDRDVAGVTGSTLTSRAVAASVRRALALQKVCVETPRS